jgi:hypothetical protein
LGSRQGKLGKVLASQKRVRGGGMDELWRQILATSQHSLGLGASCFKGSYLFSCQDLCFSFLIRLGFELRALHLQSRHSTVWATPPSPFCSGYFGDGDLKNYLPGVGLEPQSSWSQPSK